MTEKSSSKQEENQAPAFTAHGKMTVREFQQKFTELFPYLRIEVYTTDEKRKFERGKDVEQIAEDKPISQKDFDRSIIVSGDKKVGKLEQELDDVFGIYCQVCYTDLFNERYYTNTDDCDEMTLTACNKWSLAKGSKKGESR